MMKLTALFPLAEQNKAKKIKILYPMTGGKVGGSHIALLLLLENLPPLYEPFVALDEEGDFSALLTRKNIPYVVLPIRYYLGTEPGILRNLIIGWRNFLPLHRFLRHHHFDVIHVSDDPLPATFALNARCAGIPLIWYHHNHCNPSRLSHIMNKLANHEVFVSGYLRDGAKAEPAKTSLIYNPILNDDSHAFIVPSTDTLTSLNLNPTYPTIGFFSNFYDRKRPLLVADIANILINQWDTPCNFIICGDDRENLKPLLQEKIRDYGLAKHFCIHEFTYPATPLFRTCTILLAPAVYEPFGRTLIEAMQLGVLVAASNYGGHQEIIQDGVTGFLCPPDDPAAFAEKIRLYLKDQKLSDSIRKNAHAHVETTFSISKHIHEIEMLYQKICTPRFKS
jgi:glycosyltransferase involved in cell wall biosynthesis